MDPVETKEEEEEEGGMGQEALGSIYLPHYKEESICLQIYEMERG